MKVAFSEGRISKWRDVLDELSLFDAKTLSVADKLLKLFPELQPEDDEENEG